MQNIKILWKSFWKSLIGRCTLFFILGTLTAYATASSPVKARNGAAKTVYISIDGGDSNGKCNELKNDGQVKTVDTETSPKKSVAYFYSDSSCVTQICRVSRFSIDKKFANIRNDEDNSKKYVCGARNF
ncbi:MAG: hypothetical protein AABY34_06610 [Pseudomonadota bacterium]